MVRAAMAMLACLGVSGGVLASPPPERSTAGISVLIEAAGEGEVVAVPAGVYRGLLRVVKPVVLEGAGEVTIDGGGEGTVVELLSPGVTFRGFRVRGSSAHLDGEPAGIRAEAGPVVIEDNVLEDVLFGIDLRSSPESVVRGNVIEGKDLEVGRRGDGIRLWWSAGSTIEDNTVRRARDAVFWYSEGITIRRNLVEDGRYGLHFMYSHHTLLSHNVLRNNSVGVYLMYSNGITIERCSILNNRGPSGYGIGLKDCDDVVVRDSRILANRVGIYADNSPFSIGSEGLIEANLIAFNEIGVAMTPQTHDNLFVGNGFVENEEQAAALGRGDLKANAFGREGRGNFWSNYAGFDADGDGIGDLAYESVSLFENLLAREPSLRLFVHSPAQQAIEFTARAMPEVRPEPKFVDSSPLMRPPRVAGPETPAPTRWPMGVVSLGLLGVGVGVVTLAQHGSSAGVASQRVEAKGGSS